MKKFFIIFILLLSSVPFSKAEIKEIHSIKEAQNQFNAADRDTLVIFDVDLVLVRPENEIFNHIGNVRLKKMFEQLISPLSVCEFCNFNNLLVLAYKSVLMENETPALIKQMQVKGVKIIALTGGKAGKVGNFNNAEQIRYDILKTKEIDFSSSFSEYPKFEFEDFSPWKE